MEDTIVINQLEIMARVGVSAAERAAAQRLTVSLRLIPTRPFAGLADDLASTVDYAAVSDAVRKEVESKPRGLIETVAEDIAALLLSRFPLRSVEVEVCKFILPGTEYVAVLIRRERSA